MRKISPGEFTVKNEPTSSAGSFRVSSTRNGLRLASPTGNGQPTAPAKNTPKILCYMPSNLKKVKIPIKIQNLQNNNLSVIGQNVTSSSNHSSSSPSPKSSTLQSDTAPSTVPSTVLHASTVLHPPPTSISVVVKKGRAETE